MRIFVIVSHYNSSKLMKGIVVIDSCHLIETGET